MSEKVDEIAKAIRNECQKYGYLVSIPEGNRAWVYLARAAIAGLRKPTLEMIEAGENSCGSNGEIIDVEAIWQDMIDELLK